ncbi:Zinc finger protein 143 [Fusarium oxysporum f. sp. cubense]|uniref:Zinc finger protein 143 n=1 Tax=Fusarium oxysporum f. sp. cubense TaxID=61366 RepID=A0A559LHL5_FUSOC|nr:Zinc finger protein 143 [Fusarium oxysporum f. sp. cubense]
MKPAESVENESTARPFQCDWQSCPKSFTRKSDFVRHYRIHTDERPYVCPIPGCGKRFTRPDIQAKHMLTHTGKKPHQCRHIGFGKRFTDASTLARHRWRLHQQEMSPNDSNDSDDDGSPSTPQLPMNQVHGYHIPQLRDNRQGIPASVPHEYHGTPVPEQYTPVQPVHRATTMTQEVYYVTEAENPYIFNMAPGKRFCFLRITFINVLKKNLRSTSHLRISDGQTIINYAEEESSDGEPEIEAYGVEKIKCRRIEEDGTESFLVKWKDCEKASWVPKENFEGVGEDSLEEYYERMAKENNPIAESDSVSRNKRPLDDTLRRSKRQQVGKGSTRNVIATSPTTEKRSIRPGGSWGDKIKSIDACYERPTGGFTICFRCHNGDKFRANSKVLQKECPKELFKYYEKHMKAPFEDEIVPENTMEELSSPSTVEKQSAPCKSCEDEIETIVNLGRNGAGLLEFAIAWKNGEKTKGEGATVLNCVQKVILLPLLIQLARRISYANMAQAIQLHCNHCL